MTDPDDVKKTAEIGNVVENLLRAINANQYQNMEDEKNLSIYIYLIHVFFHNYKHSE